MKKSALVVFAFIVVILAYARIPWEWGIMDDSGYVFEVQHFIQANGFWEGLKQRIISHAQLDFSAGVLRPSFWFHATGIYLLPVNWAYTVRFLQFLFILIFTVDALLRFGGKTIFRPGHLNRAEKISVGFLLAGILSIRSLYDGIALVSLQEFSGLFFVSLFLWLLSFRGFDVLAIAALFIGVGFKPPYVWALLFFSLYFFAQKKWTKGTICFVSYILFFSASIYLVNKGFYSRAIYKPSYESIFVSLVNGAKHGLAPMLVLACAIFYWKKITISEILFGKSWCVGLCLFLSGAMYFVTMLPRGVGRGLGYYFSPALYEMIVGALFVLHSGISQRISATPKKQWNFWFLTSAGVAVIVLVFSASKIWQRNSAIVALRNWALSLPESERFLATNSGEVAVRLSELFAMRSDGQWSGKVFSLMEKDSGVPRAKYYLVFADQAPPKADAMNRLLWARGSVKVFAISP